MELDSNYNPFKLNRNSLIELYDQRAQYGNLGSPITAITSLIGEDLVLGLLDHYLRSKDDDDGIDWQRINYSCRVNGLRGPRLDAWIETKNNTKTLYQTEIKNWCASAIGGRQIDNTTFSWLRACEHNRRRYLSDPQTARQVWKVLSNMYVPQEYEALNPKPLLGFWSPISRTAIASPDTCLEPFFEVETEEFKNTIQASGLFTTPSYAKKVSIFSASNYLRGIENIDVLEVCMPRVRHRLETMKNLGLPICFEAK